MADVGDHVASHLVGMLEFVRHDVERVGEFAHFVTAVLLDVHTGGIIAFGHGLRRIDHLGQWTGQMPGGDVREHLCRGDGDWRCDPSVQSNHRGDPCELERQNARNDNQDGQFCA